MKVCVISGGKNSDDFRVRPPAYYDRTRKMSNMKWCPRWTHQEREDRMVIVLVVWMGVLPTRVHRVLSSRRASSRRRHGHQASRRQQPALLFSSLRYKTSPSNLKINEFKVKAKT